jgi:Cu-processing system ATP-binding protein
MFNPDLLILDEPTAGLDPRASFQLKKKIMKAKNSGRTLIITSHIMSEIQELADNIVFLLEGEIKIDGTVNNLIQTKQATNLEHAIANMMDTFTA